MIGTSAVEQTKPSKFGAVGSNERYRFPEESELICPNDMALRDSLHALVASNPDFWDFRGTAHRDFAHGYFQYPAMMVPNMVGRALDHVAAHRRGPIHLLDPFAGSGTVVTEAVARGWDVTAVDVNPLAALLCRTKAGPFFPKAMAAAAAKVLSEARNMRTKASHWFPNVRKWFEPEVIYGLSCLREAIVGVNLPAARRFLWVAMAETVRLTSNSRLSTVKLHIKAAEDRVPTDAVEVFTRIVARNLELLEAETEALRSAGLLHRGWPSTRTRVLLGDATDIDLSGVQERPNVLVTSPPYGDNHSTITYGQHSYLPLQWINLPDTGATDNSTLLGPTAIDYMSLGGRRENGIERAEDLSAKSEAARATLCGLAKIRQDHSKKVGAFLSDLDKALDRTLRALAHRSHIVVTVGDRTVSGTRVPTARIVQDMVTARGAVVIAAIPRRLPASRRMASRKQIRLANQHRVDAHHEDPLMTGLTLGVHPRVVFQLGESLVTDPVQALLELVKNSYDADATFVSIDVDTHAGDGGLQGRITVVDNGIGMSKQTILDGWLTISVSPKAAMKKAGQTSARLHRVPLGDKGVRTSWNSAPWSPAYGTNLRGPEPRQEAFSKTSTRFGTRC